MTRHQGIIKQMFRSQHNNFISIIGHINHLGQFIIHLIRSIYIHDYLKTTFCNKAHLYILHKEIFQSSYLTFLLLHAFNGTIIQLI